MHVKNCAKEIKFHAWTLLVFFVFCFFLNWWLGSWLVWIIASRYTSKQKLYSNVGRCATFNLHSAWVHYDPQHTAKVKIYIFTPVITKRPADITTQDQDKPFNTVCKLQQIGQSIHVQTSKSLVFYAQSTRAVTSGRYMQTRTPCIPMVSWLELSFQSTI